MEREALSVATVRCNARYQRTNNVCRLKYIFQCFTAHSPGQSNITRAWTDYNRVLQHQMKALLLSYSFIASRGSGLALIKTGQ